MKTPFVTTYVQYLLLHACMYSSNFGCFPVPGLNETAYLICGVLYGM